jgi:toxin ParE1/3/4
MSDSAHTYRLFPLAETDLEDIWLYTFKNWSREQADRYHANLIAAFEGLACGEKKGRRVDIREGYFKCAIGAHFVYYRETDIGIDVVRVLHQRMDADRHL